MEDILRDNDAEHEALVHNESNEELQREKLGQHMGGFELWTQTPVETHKGTDGGRCGNDCDYLAAVFEGDGDLAGWADCGGRDDLDDCVDSDSYGEGIDDEMNGLEPA